MGFEGQIFFHVNTQMFHRFTWRIYSNCHFQTFNSSRSAEALFFQLEGICFEALVFFLQMYIFRRFEFFSVCFCLMLWISFLMDVKRSVVGSLISISAFCFWFKVTNDFKIVLPSFCKQMFSYLGQYQCTAEYFASIAKSFTSMPPILPCHHSKRSLQLIEIFSATLFLHCGHLSSEEDWSLLPVQVIFWFKQAVHSPCAAPKQ